MKNAMIIKPTRSPSTNCPPPAQQQQQQQHIEKPPATPPAAELSSLIQNLSFNSNKLGSNRPALWTSVASSSSDHCKVRRRAVAGETIVMLYYTILYYTKLDAIY